MSKHRNVLLAAALLIQASACSWTTAVPVNDSNRNIGGFRVYGTKPLLVIQNGTVSVTYVPNYSKEYAVRYGVFLTKNDTVLKIGPGQTLLEVTSNMDGTGPLSSILNFAAEAVKQGSESALGTLFSISPGVAVETRLAIFDIEFAPDGSVTRLKPLTSPAMLDAAFIRLPGPPVATTTPTTPTPPPPTTTPGTTTGSGDGGGVPFDGR